MNQNLITEASRSFYSCWCWHKSKVMENYGLMTESDMDAAQNLMQLSDEEKNNNITRSKRRRSNDEQEVDKSLNDSIMAKIQEIFGKDIEVFPARKHKRYRSLVNIYMATRPVNGGNDTRIVFQFHLILVA
ncbi:hypothetical protein VNO77_00816 [Canavalia gladiata]|uniref:Uncharacterized protein n=1 Tax=Canavalia gladiata TaxID=3824 RepID=A0AAN9MQR9_CANGL